MEQKDIQKDHPNSTQTDGENGAEEHRTPYRTIKDESKRAFIDRLIRNSWSDACGGGTA